MTSLSLAVTNSCLVAVIIVIGITTSSTTFSLSSSSGPGEWPQGPCIWWRKIYCNRKHSSYHAALIIFPPNSMLKGGTRPRNFLKGQSFKATWVWTTGGPQTQPNQTGDGINFASKISGHVLVFQPVVLLCWSTICNVDPWLGFLYTVPPHPLISMLWRALFIHLRNLFREKADAAQGIKEHINIEIGGRGGVPRKIS